jgi:hypothetical protein
MNKYKVEGGIDFFAELYKSLDIEENEEKTDEDKNKCLITNEILTNNHISLNCGHKFNYLPLFYDLVNHKKKFNFMESQSGKLQANQIRCPYCRKKHDALLPYYPELGVEQINGVNFYNPNIKDVTTIKNKCEFLIPNPDFNPDNEETNTNQKNIPCVVPYGTKIWLYNKENPLVPITFGDTKCYCYEHKKIMIKQYKAKEKENEKIAKKEAKELEKENKLLEKKKAKDEKQKAKAELDSIKKQIKEGIKSAKKYINSASENVVLGPSMIQNQTENIVGCVQILKTGPNKGNQCGCKILADNLCKRHTKKNIVD